MRDIEMNFLILVVVFWLGVVLFIVPLIVLSQRRLALRLQARIEDLEQRLAKSEAQTSDQPTPTDQDETSPASTSIPAVLSNGSAMDPDRSPQVQQPISPPLLSHPLIPLNASIRPPQENSFINWERFLGVKLFAWIGGLALFLGVAFFIKYSFENNLISPQTRISCGYLFALMLMVGGLLLSRERHVVTVQTLCATSTLILYANTFAAHAYYKFIGPTPAFILMALITVTAFLLALRLDGQVIAVLGLLGGFLTPPLLSTGVDNPLGLFGYLAVLDAGLIAVALRKRWHYLVLLAALLTIGMEIGWVLRFFEAGKVFTAMGVFLVFSALFLSVSVLHPREEPMDNFLVAPCLLLPATAFGFAGFLAFGSYTEIGSRAPLILGFVMAVDLALITAVWLRIELRPAIFATGGFIFVFFASWLNRFLNAESLNWAMGFVFLFTVLHALTPIYLQRLKPSPVRLNWLHLAPLAGLVLILLFILKLPTISWLIWPVVLLINGIVLILAITTAVVWGVLVSFALTLILAGIWIIGVPAEVTRVPLLLTVIGGFALFFGVAGAWVSRHILSQRKPSDPNLQEPDAVLTQSMFEQISSIASALPFLLLTLVVLQLPLGNPNSVFGLALILLICLLGVCIVYGTDLVILSGLASVLILEHTWHFTRFQPPQVLLAVSWYLGFGMLFFLFPFCFRAKMQNRRWPWVAAALALPLHFLALYRGFVDGFPDFPYKGLIPAALALPCLIATVSTLRRTDSDPAHQQTRLAMFGGATLFFITFIFPIQFDRQWITIGWAFEGVALLWLFHRVPHPGLRIVGCVLLVGSFIRLALNPSIMQASARGSQPLLNWYLYAYALVAGSQFLAARLLAPPRHKLKGYSLLPLFYTLGTILLFLLVNIQIADYFSPAGERLRFTSTDRFDQDMAYSLAWGGFAFVMLILGFKWKLLPVRAAGMGLLVVTLLKLFLHDLWQLGGLYRIGSLFGLAVLLMVSSFIYQRFLSAPATPTQPPEPPPTSG